MRVVNAEFNIKKVKFLLVLFPEFLVGFKISKNKYVFVFVFNGIVFFET